MASFSQPPGSSQTPLSAAATALPSTSRPSTTTTKDDNAFTFPPIYAFPPFFTLQPNPTTLSSQLLSWSTLIQAYCRHHRLFSLTLVDALTTPLFNNTTLARKISIKDARSVVNWMASAEGGNRAEWIGTGTKSKAGEEAGRCWVYWKRPEEWAAALEEWVDRTGQKGTVVTLYEIQESDATRREEFFGIDSDLLTKSLQLCVKRGKAQIFGAEGSEGVKFF